MRDIAAIFPDTVATSGHDLRMYDLADPEPRAPFLETDWSFASTLSGTPLPSECAIVASYQGERVSGLPQRRRRGRMYLGPLDGNVLTSDGRITSIAYNSVNGAMEDFVNALEVDDITFGIWSTVDEQLVTVRSGWTDNAYDIQRRRGVLPTVRVTWLKD